MHETFSFDFGDSRFIFILSFSPLLRFRSASIPYVPSVPVMFKRAAPPQDPPPDDGASASSPASGGTAVQQAKKKVKLKKDGTVDKRGDALQQRADRNKGTVVQSVKASLRNVAPPIILPAIERAVLTATQLAASASRLANIHVARCLQANIAIQPIDATFYYHCMLAFSTSGLPTGCNQDLVATAQLLPDKQVLPIDYMGVVLQTHAAEMVVAASNHLVLRLDRLLKRLLKPHLERLVRDVRGEDGKSLSRGTKEYGLKSVIWALEKRIDSTFQHDWQTALYRIGREMTAYVWQHLDRDADERREKKRKEKAAERANKAKKVANEADMQVDGVEESNNETDDDIKVFVINSLTSKAFRSHAHILLPLYRSALQEAIVAGHKQFSLLPVFKRGRRHIPITSGALAQLYLLAGHMEGDSSKYKICTIAQAAANKQQLWVGWTLQHVLSKGPRARFDHSIKTDGVAVTLCMRKPATRAQEDDEDEDAGEAARTTKQIPLADVAALKTPIPLAQVNLVGARRPTRVLGIDPGRGNTFTWAVDGLGDDVDLEALQNKLTILEVKRVKQPDQGTEACGHFTPGRYHDLIGQHASRQHRRNKIQRSGGLDAVTSPVADALAQQTQASFKVPDAATLVTAYGTYQSTHAVLQPFEAQRSFAKRRFNLYSDKRSVLHAIAQDISTLVGDDGVVSYGNAAFGPSFGKGYETAPTKGLRRTISAVSPCIDWDEYYSSQVCSNADCHHRGLKKMEHTTPRAFRSHGVVTCERCHQVWNRDVNSARNMRDGLRYAFDHVGNENRRPEYLRRANVLRTLPAQPRGTTSQ